MNSETKKPIGVTIAGILSLASGIFLLYVYIRNLSYKPWLQANQGFIEYIDSSLGNRTGFLIASLLISSYGLFKLKPWARYGILFVAGSSFLYEMGSLFTFGIYTRELYYLSSFTICIVVLWYFNRKHIKELFPYQKWAKTFKILSILWIVGLMFLVVGYSWEWYSEKGYMLPKLERTVHAPVDNSPNSFRTPFPLPYSIEIPNSFTVLNFDLNENTGKTIWLITPNQDILFLNEISMRQQSYYDSGWKFGFKSPYSFAKKFYNERYGLVFVILKSLNELGGKVCSIEESQIGSVNVFIQKAQSDKKFGRTFDIYLNGDAKGGGEFNCRKSTKSLNNQQVDNMIASIKPQGKSTKSARDFSQEGLDLYNKGDFEKAKFFFASALCLEWNNPDYHYNLAKAFFETKNWYRAEKHFKETLKLKKDYPMAQEYLNKANKERLLEEKAEDTVNEQKRVTL